MHFTSANIWWFMAHIKYTFEPRQYCLSIMAQVFDTTIEKNHQTDWITSHSLVFAIFMQIEVRCIISMKHWALSIDILTSRQHCTHARISHAISTNFFVRMQIEWIAFLYNFNFQIGFYTFSKRLKKRDRHICSLNMAQNTETISKRVRWNLSLFVSWVNKRNSWMSKRVNDVSGFAVNCVMCMHCAAVHLCYLWFFGTYSTFSCNMISKVIKPHAKSVKHNSTN